MNCTETKQNKMTVMNGSDMFVYSLVTLVGGIVADADLWSEV